ncbi:MAG: hypothetical protein WCG01_00680 [bacterium]
MNFFERYKKLMIGLAFIGFTALIGYFLYIVFFKQSVTTIPITDDQSGKSQTGLPSASLGTDNQIINNGTEQKLTGQNTNNNTPTPDTGSTADLVAKGGITKVETLTNTPSYGVNMAKGSNDARYYDSTEGKFYKIDANGNKTALSDKSFFEVQKVTWSGANNKAILEYPDGSKTIYDFDKQNQITLPEHWKDFSFSPDGSEIVMKTMANDVNNRWLAVTSADGNKVYPVERIGDEASIIPSWSPNKQIVAMYTEGAGLNSQKVYFVGLNGENFKSATIDGRDFRPQWSPQGDVLAYSTYSDSSDLKPSMYVVPAQGEHIGENTKNLEINTWADKCSFADNTTLYCAVPKELERGAGLFPKMADNTADDIYKIDVQSGLKTKIAVPETDLNIVEMSISADGSNLFFNDKATGLLHKIKLK